MLRGELLSPLAAALAPAQAEEAAPGDRPLSEEWKKRTLLYVKAVNRAIETERKDFPQPVSADLTGRVFDLARKGEDEFSIGSGRFREPIRYVATSDDATPLRW